MKISFSTLFLFNNSEVEIGLYLNLTRIILYHYAYNDLEERELCEIFSYPN